MSNKKIAALAVAGLVVVGAASAFGSVPARAFVGRGRRAGSDGAVVQRALKRLVAMPGGPPGAIVIVQRGTDLTVHRAGVRDLSRGGAISISDHMRLASTSKAFSGAVALALVDHHLLSLRDTIAKLLPQLPAAWGRVTLAQALDHTSGLPDFTTSSGFQRFFAGHLHATPSPRFLLHFIATERLRFAPGTRYRYSNTDNFIVALMAEAATHRTYAQLLSGYVFKPLGLAQTSLPAGFDIPVPYLHGYQLEPGSAPEDISTLASAGYAWASGGLLSTPADLNRFIRGYAGARLFSRAIQSRQLRFVSGGSEPTGPGQNAAGLGIFRYRTRCGTVYGHTGNIFGYTQFMAATLGGRRSVTVSISEQLNQHTHGAQLAAFGRLRQVEQDAVCAALS